MERDEVLRLLAEHREELAAFQVQSLALFGSTVRGQAGLQSDVDILVEFSGPVGLFQFVRLQRRLEQILGRRVDLVTREALRDSMRDKILGEAVYA